MAPFPLRLSPLAAALAATLLIAGCDTAEERAEEHYQNALALLAENDVERARVELQTVFQFNSEHRQARAALAALLMEQGDVGRALGHYTRLVETFPDETEGRFILSEMALLQKRWEEAEQQIAGAVRAAPDAPHTAALENVLAYRAAVIAEDDDARDAAAERARALKADVPESVANRLVLIDKLVLAGEHDEALQEIAEAQALAPENPDLYLFRLNIAYQRNDTDLVESALKDMVETFPDRPEAGRALIEFYMLERRTDDAEAYLRSRIVPGEAADGPRSGLISFLRASQGNEAALAQTEAFIEEGTNPTLFRATRAALLYEMGDVDAAIAEFEATLEGAEPGEVTHNAKMGLARILMAQGNEVGARALVEEILAEDSGHVDALRTKAAWLLQADRTEEVIVLLRRALDQEPDNPLVLYQMAQAQFRAGNRDLAGENLAAAVRATENGARESIAYARFLAEDSRLAAAEGVISDALEGLNRRRVGLERRSLPYPGAQLDLLSELGRIYVAQENWERADMVQQTIRTLPFEDAERVANTLRLMVLRGQDRGEDAVAYLQTLAEQSDGDIGTELAVITALAQRDELDEAGARLEALMADDPDNPTLRYARAGLDSRQGNLDSAEARYRALIADGFAQEPIWLELLRVLAAQGRDAEVEETLEAAIAANPGSLRLLSNKAGRLEARGDIDGAIEIYEALYAENSGNVLLANNLASLISGSRTDEESLDRAWRIARRLRGNDNPALMDTYGWIAHLRGDNVEALAHLEPAHRALPDNPQVQAHLGLTYLALGQPELGRPLLEAAVAQAGDDSRTAFARARQALADLSNRGNPAPGTSD